MEKPPRVVVIAGSNGAGKSTCAPILLRDRFKLMEFANPDSIAVGLSAFRPDSVAFEAGRVMLSRLREMGNAKADFAFESTLSGRSYAAFLSKLISEGYEFHLLYVWVRSADIAVRRVQSRVRRGGHNVPEDQIRRRYDRSRYNFNELYSPLASSWSLFDNTERPIVHVAEGGRSLKTTVHDPQLWTIFSRSANDSTNTTNI